MWGRVQPALFKKKMMRVNLSKAGQGRNPVMTSGRTGSVKDREPPEADDQWRHLEVAFPQVPGPGTPEVSNFMRLGQSRGLPKEKFFHNMQRV